MSFLAKKRIYISQFFSIVALLSIFFITPKINNSLYNFLTLSVGIMFVFIGITGRVFSSIFIGNLKNKKVIDYGMYSITRNPLYFFSFIGFLGVLIFTGVITFVIIGVIFFIFYYYNVITYEGKFLLDKFGEDYKKYQSSVPIFFPNIKKWSCPNTVEVDYKSVLKTLIEASYFLLFLFIIKLINIFSSNFKIISMF